MARLHVLSTAISLLGMRLPTCCLTFAFWRFQSGCCVDCNFRPPRSSLLGPFSLPEDCESDLAHTRMLTGSHLLVSVLCALFESITQVPLSLVIRVGNHMQLSKLANNLEENLSDTLNWCAVELAAAIACACLPCFGPLLPTRNLANRLHAWYSSHRGTSTGNTSAGRLKYSNSRRFGHSVDSGPNTGAWNGKVKDSDEELLETVPPRIAVRTSIEVK